MSVKTGHKQILIQVMEHIYRGFKMGCAKEDQTMTTVLAKFMENYSRAKETYQDAVVEVEAVDEIRELGL